MRSTVVLVLFSVLRWKCFRGIRFGEDDESEETQSHETAQDQYYNIDGSSSEPVSFEGKKVIHVKGFSKGAAGTIHDALQVADQIVAKLQSEAADIIVWDGDQPPVDGNAEIMLEDGSTATWSSLGCNPFDMTDIFTNVIVKAMDAMPRLHAVSFNTAEDHSWGRAKAIMAWRLYVKKENKPWGDRMHWVGVSDDKINATVANGGTKPESLSQGAWDLNYLPVWEALGAYALAQTRGETVVSLGLAATTLNEARRVCYKDALNFGKAPDGVSVKMWHAFKATRKIDNKPNEDKFPWESSKSIVCGENYTYSDLS